MHMLLHSRRPVSPSFPLPDECSSLSYHVSPSYLLPKQKSILAEADRSKDRFHKHPLILIFTQLALHLFPLSILKHDPKLASQIKFINFDEIMESLNRVSGITIYETASLVRDRLRHSSVQVLILF